ncbi:MAG: hypothetical protein JXB10_03405 [Pirellulales bacterium]|nr:hypothetical protein [Pirellulales bacterium]
MAADNWQARLQTPLRTLQITVLALAAGSGFFAAIVIFLGLEQPWDWNLSVMTLIALIYGGSSVFLRLVVPPLIVTRGRKGILNQLRSGLEEVGNDFRFPALSDANVAWQFLALLNTRTIIAGALLEGAIFFLLVVSMTDNSLLAISLAALLWLLLIAHFPTHGWTQQWIEDQWRLLQEEQCLRRQ